MLHRVNKVNVRICTSRVESTTKAGIPRTNLDSFWHLGPGGRVAKITVSQDNNAHHGTSTACEVPTCPEL